MKWLPDSLTQYGERGSQATVLSCGKLCSSIKTSLEVGKGGKGINCKAVPQELWYFFQV